MQFEKLFKMFCTWVKDVEEDTPLPYECNVICFGLTKNGEVFFSGSEFVPEQMVPCEFYPLEAQCFDYTIKCDFFIFEKLIKEFDKIKNVIFDAKIICYAKEFEKPIII